MFKKSLEFFRKDKTLWLAVLLFAIAVFLRFYHFSEFVTFLGDQGRDAIVLKRILTFEHFPAIGAPTSVGQVYLGPFYYYFIAPWLLLFNFNPIGPAVGVAILSSIFILVNYIVVKKLFDRIVGLISSTLLTFSFVLIEFSRFSWNPNLLPLFSLLTAYATIFAVKRQKKLFYILAGSFFSFTIQLHYLALFLAPPIVVIFAWELWEHKKEWKQSLKNIFASIMSFVFFSSPLLIFDLRHDFLNSKNFMKVFQTQLNIILLGLLLFMLFVLFFLHVKKNRNLAYIALFFLLSLIGLSFYSGPKYPHYFGAVYPFYFILVGYLLANLFKSRLSIPIFFVFMALYIFFNGENYYYFSHKGSDQIGRAQKIAVAVQNSITKKKFSVTALPNQYSDATYRYFLELLGVRPLEKDTLEPSQELFVICEGVCKPIGNPQWDIAYFEPKKVEETKKIFDPLIMYRLSN